MLSFQDIIAKTTTQRKQITECLQKTNDKVGWHPEDTSLYDGLNTADTYEIREALANMTLAEVLVKGSTAMGADAIVAAKLHGTLILAAKSYDLCELIGYVVTRWEGADLNVNVTVDGSYTPKPFSSAGKLADVNAKFVQCTATPIGYGIPILYGGDLKEDQDYGIAQWHVEQAGKQCGLFAGNLALNILKTAPDGDGSLNTEAGAADETNIADVIAAMAANGQDEFTSNTMLLTDEAWEHSLYDGQVAGGTAGDYGIPHAQYKQPAAGFDFNYMTLDSKWCNLPALHAAMPGTDTPGGAFTNCVTLVFDRFNALLTARKRWLEIKDFANPIEDLAGAVVSFRQDSVTLYKDAICAITEA